MRLLVICALVIGVGVLLLIGLWAMANELYSQSIFGAPFEADDADEEQFASLPHHSSGDCRRAGGWRGGLTINDND